MLNIYNTVPVWKINFLNPNSVFLYIKIITSRKQEYEFIYDMYVHELKRAELIASTYDIYSFSVGCHIFVYSKSIHSN